jgi:putative cell wall-binding protein
LWGKGALFLRVITKFYSSLAVVTLLSSCILTPSSVEGKEQYNSEFDQKKEEIVKQLEQRSLEPSMFRPISFTSQNVVTQATYKQQIDENHIHEYLFTTEGGIFTVEPLHQETDDINYLIYEVDSEELIEPTGNNTFNLSKGDYYFVVMGFSEKPIGYEFKLNGPFSEPPNTLLPELNVTNPSRNNLRLAKGTSPVFPIKGNSNADYLSVFLNNEGEVSLTAPGEFRWDNIVLAKGVNDLTFIATKSGNSVISSYTITLPGISRIFGKDRYAVSGNVSSSLRYWGYGNGSIIIARGDLFPDALSGAPLAFAEEAPILLTKTKSLSQSVIWKIEDLGADKAIILGGTSSVSPEVEGQLKKLGVKEIDRISGKDRFAVSASVAERVVEYEKSDTAIIASGEVFPDALSASTLAGPTGMPILLVKSGSIPDSIQTFIKKHPEIKSFIIVGGPVAVKDSVVTKLKELRRGAFVKRIGGNDRYDVSINIAKYAMDNYGIDLSTVVFARGDLFPDALSGAPLANFFNAPILLTPTNRIDEKVNAFLTTHLGETEHIYILGETGSISTNVEQQLNKFIR